MKDHVIDESVIRELFAAAALNALIAELARYETNLDLAGHAYAIADAMLEMRNQTKGSK